MKYSMFKRKSKFGSLAVADKHITKLLLRLGGFSSSSSRELLRKRGFRSSEAMIQYIWHQISNQTRMHRLTCLMRMDSVDSNQTGGV